MRAPAAWALRDPPGVARELAVEIVLVQPAFGRGGHVDDLGPRAPGQVVGVMLQLRGENHGVGRQVQPIGQLVDGLGGVLAEDDGVAAGVGPDELGDDLVGAVIGGGAQA